MSKNLPRQCVIIIDAELHEHHLVASAFMSYKDDVSVFPKQSAKALLNQAAMTDFFNVDAKQRRLTVIIPSEHISCITTPIHAKQAPFADKIIGGLIEDKLASELEMLHVNLLHIDEDNIAYAVAISRSYMHQIHNLFPEQVSIDTVIADGFCLPVQNQDMHIALIRNRIIMRKTAYEAASYPFSAIDAVTHALSELSLTHITVHHAADALAQLMIMQKILAQSAPDTQVTAHQIPEPSMHNFIQQHYNQQQQIGEVMPHLMQPFKASSSKSDNLTLAKRAAAGLAFLAIIDLLAVTLSCLALVAFVWLLDVGSQNIVDNAAPKANLSYEELIDAAGQGSSESFSDMLANSLDLYAQQSNSDPSVTYIRYNADSSELALRMTVPNFAVLQDYKSALEGAGYSAEVSANASPNNGQLVASVRISAEGYY